MKATAATLSLLLAILLAVPAVAPVSAFEQMNGVTMSFSPDEMSGGSSTHMVVTLHNGNNRTLTITILTIQIYEGMMWGSMDKYTMYQANLVDNVITTNGSKEFAVDGSAPNYLGMCSVMVTVAGIFDGDENESIGGFSASTTIQPGFGFASAGLGLMILVTLGVLVGVVVLVIILFGRKRAPPTDRRSCPACGGLVVPGAVFCTRCGRKL